MSLENILAFGFVVLFALLIIGYILLNRWRPWRNLREIPAFARLVHAIGLAVEDGTRIHTSLGHGSLTGTQSAAGFVGLSMLAKVVEVASESDHPPVSSAGASTLAILSQDTLRATYQESGSPEQFQPTSGRLVGLTPFSYAAGTIPIIEDEEVAASVLIGNFGSEVALITEAGERSESFTLAGADNLPAQAVLFATAEEPLIGEEVYAGGAYLDIGAAHAASVRAQDVLRWLLVGVILIGGALKVVGF